MPFPENAEGAEGSERETLVVFSRPPGVDGLRSQRRLLVRGTLRLANGSGLEILALVDTGPEVNLVRKGLLDERHFNRTRNPKRFVAADQGIMEGGLLELPCELLLQGTDVDTGRATQVACPITFYDAGIKVDTILLYEWFRQADIEI